MKWEKIGISVLFAIALVGCGKDESDSPQVSPDLNLTELGAEAGCLNVSSLQGAMESIGSQTAMFSYPVRLEMGGSSGVRTNFKRLMALNLLAIDEGPLSSFHAFESAAQEGCNSINVKKTDGVIKEFKIKPSSEEFNQVEAVAEDGEAIKYEILNPRRVRLTRKYLAYDIPCHSENKAILISVTRIIDWNAPNAPSMIAMTDEQMVINRELLKLAAEAAGYDEGNLYISSTGDGLESRMINVAKVRELSQMPPTLDVLACYGNADPIPPSEPDPPEDPSDPAEEGTN